MRRLAVLALFLAAPAAADDTNQEPKLAIKSIRLDGMVARLVLHWDLGTVQAHDAAYVNLPVPVRTVVSSATAIAGGQSHRLSLLRADDAAGAFEAITTAAARDRRASAITITGDPKTQSMNAELIVPEATHVEIEAEAEMPTCFFHGVRYAQLPETGLAPEIEALRAKHGVAVEENCGGASGTEWYALSKPDADAPRIAAVGSRLHLPARDFASVELDVAEQLADIPSDLATVILVDGSRSVTAQEAEVQRAIVLAYLHASPHSRVQVIAYARKARALLPGWSDATAAAARVDRELRGLAVKNGSNADAALDAAAQWLARTHGTKRVLLFTDERTASRFDEIKPQELAAKLPPHTLVHVVAIETGDGGLAHDDNVIFGPLAVATEGIGVNAHVPKKGEVDVELLLRPLSLEHIAMQAPGWKPATQMSLDGCGLAPDATIERGHSCTWWGEGTAVAGPVTMTAMLWNKRVTRVVRPDPGAARTLARRLVTETEFDTEVADEIARAAFALDSFWSFFGTWGGSGGYGDEELGRIGMGGFGSSSDDFGSSDGGFGHGSGTGTHLDFHAQLQPAIDACHARNARVEIETETTVEEIVDVAVRTSDPFIQSCITEKVWDTFLSIEHAPRRTTTTTVFDR